MLYNGESLEFAPFFVCFETFSTGILFKFRFDALKLSIRNFDESTYNLVDVNISPDHVYIGFVTCVYFL